MRIVHIVHKALPDAHADSEQLVNTMAALGAAGAEAVLAIPAVSGAATPDRAELAAHFQVPDAFDARYFSRVRAGHPFLTSYGHARTVLHAENFLDADAFITRRPEVARLAVRLGRPVLLDSYKPWPEMVPFGRGWFRRLSNRPSFLGALPHSEFAAESFRGAGVAEDRIFVAHNGFAPARLEPRLGRAAARQQLGLSASRPVALYAGRLAMDKGLAAVLDMARAMPDILFVLLGSTGDGPVERAAETIDNVEIRPRTDFAGIAPYLFAADALLIPPTAAPLRKRRNVVLPLKTYLYLGSGRPILAPDLPDTAELLKHHETAYLVPPDDIAGAICALRHLVDDRPLAERLARNALALSTHFTWRARAEKILEFVAAKKAAR